MKDLENNRIEDYPSISQSEVCPYIPGLNPFPALCFTDDEVNWQTHKAPYTDLANQSRYSTYSDGNDGYFFYKTVEALSSEPISDPVGSYFGKLLDLPVIPTGLMVSTNHTGRHILGVVSQVVSWTGLAADDDVPDEKILNRMNKSALVGDGILRAWMRDHDHRWSHVMIVTGSDSTQYYYIIDHGRAFEDAQSRWNEKALLDSGVGECLWETQCAFEVAMGYVRKIQKIPDWEIATKPIEIALSIQKYNIPQKQWYLRRAYEMSSFLIKSKRTLEHDIKNWFGRT